MTALYGGEEDQEGYSKVPEQYPTVKQQVNVFIGSDELANEERRPRVSFASWSSGNTEEEYDITEYPEELGNKKLKVPPLSKVREMQQEDYPERRGKMKWSEYLEKKIAEMPDEIDEHSAESQDEHELEHDKVYTGSQSRIMGVVGLEEAELLVKEVGDMALGAAEGAGKGWTSKAGEVAEKISKVIKNPEMGLPDWMTGRLTASGETPEEAARKRSQNMKRNPRSPFLEDSDSDDF
ncbi:hypothetical protein QBC43DRAFT_285855 [Cladorrhinum sp. PSN259]|nr:hypothetical protein QBC43DRAFT_285855 [Cladorrhinum sp. PSN259]